MKLTIKQAKALIIINSEDPIRPARFAEKMWPDSDCWQKS
jgi:hypothetical protein